VADGAKRIFYGFLTAFRQLRNPSFDGLFPPQGEFFSLQGLEPGSAQYPVTPAGDYEGANVVNPMAQFVFGSVHSGQYGEADRLSAINLGSPGSSPSGLW
jgi:hypothetical protein